MRDCGEECEYSLVIAAVVSAWSCSWSSLVVALDHRNNMRCRFFESAFTLSEGFSDGERVRE